MEHRQGCGDGSGRLGSARVPLCGCGSKELHPGLLNQDSRARHRARHSTHGVLMDAHPQVPSHWWEEEEKGACKHYPSYIPQEM